MPGNSYTIEIRAPPAIVWETVCDVDSFPEYVSDCAAVRAIGQDKIKPIRPGSKWIECRKLGWRVVPIQFTATRRDHFPPKADQSTCQLSVFSKLWGCDISVSFTMEPTKNGAKVTNSYGIVPRTKLAKLVYYFRAEERDQLVYKSIQSDLEGIAKAAEMKGRESKRNRN